MQYFKISFILTIAMAVFLSLTGCAELLKILEQSSIQEPRVECTGTKISGLSFDKIDLLFDLKVTNPNSISIHLSGYDYDLIISDASFLNGQQNNAIDLAANGSSLLQLPISITFKSLFEIYQSVKDADSLRYTLKTGFSFNLPVLGDVRIPVSRDGSFPVVRIPSISLSQIRLNKLNFMGADLKMSIRVQNPNAFSLNLKGLDYKLDVNGSNWFSGKNIQNLYINGKGESVLELPFSLNFLEMGKTAYDMLSGSAKLQYKFSGKTDLTTSLKLLGEIKLPFNKEGDISLTK